MNMCYISTTLVLAQVFFLDLDDICIRSEISWNLSKHGHVYSYMEVLFWKFTLQRIFHKIEF